MGANMRSPDLSSFAAGSVAKNRHGPLFELPAQAASLFIFRLGRRGKLLRHAVDGAEAEDEIAAVNRHDFAPREKFVEGVQGDSIVGIIEYRNEYKFVCDIKVCIAGREALFVEKHRRGHRQRLNAKRFAVL